MLPVYAPAAASWKPACQDLAGDGQRLVLPAPNPVPAPVFVELMAGVIVAPEHAPHVTVAVAGTVNVGDDPLEQR